MGVTIIHSGTFRAKKEYHDDGWDYINDWDGWLPAGEKLTFAEKRLLVKYKRGKWKEVRPHRILPGQFYERQFNSYDGDTYTWRTKKEFWDLISKYDLFPDI